MSHDHPITVPAVSEIESRMRWLREEMRALRRLLQLARAAAAHSVAQRRGGAGRRREEGGPTHAV